MFVGGGIDTKSDPRLVEAGTLLELENMFMLRTGELRFRNGFTSLTRGRQNAPAFQASSLRALFALPGGDIGAIIPSATGTGSLPRAFWRYGGQVAAWRQGLDSDPLPTVASSSTPLSSSPGGTGSAIPDLSACDSCVAGKFILTVWSGNNLGTFYNLTDSTTGSSFTGTASFGGSVDPAIAPVKAVAGGSLYLCIVYADVFTGPPYSLKAFVIDASTGLFLTTGFVIAANAISAAQPWIDVKTKPGSSNIMIAYRATGGGVTCLEWNPNTHAIAAGPVNTAAADASMAVGWLDDSIFTGSYLLATAGATDGVKVRTMNAALAVTATNTIDATATAGIRNITGHVNTGVANYVVLWDVNATPTYDMRIKLATWRGSASVSDMVGSHGLASRSFKATDGMYYVTGSYDSTTQPSFSVFTTLSPLDAWQPTGTAIGNTPQCQIFPGFAGGRTPLANCLSTVSLLPSGRYAVALPVRQKIPSPKAGTSTLASRSISSVQLSFSSAPRHVREIGNTVFLPGGLISKFDGSLATWATFQLYPEAPVLSGSAGGGAGLTLLASYDYCAVYRRRDATGRAIRSVPSVPSTIVLTGAQDTVQAIAKSAAFSPNFSETTQEVEFYRRGPAGSGATTWNYVGSDNPSTGAGMTAVLVDGLTDTVAASGEILYTTGNTLENFPPPSHNLLEVNAGRVWVVNAEDPTELWPSKEYKPGLGIGFHQLLSFRVTGDGYGAITALAAMDGRLVVFKSSAIYIITGDGPNDAGQGSFNPPQAVSLAIGTVLPGSVVHTPDGIMFQSAKGIYLLSRGFALSYIGKPVEQYTTAETTADTTESVVDASLVDGTTHVRFVLPSGRCLVYDYDLQRWYTFLLPVGASTIVACANIPSGWCYGLADGTVKQEVAGQYSDDGVAIVPRLVFPNLDLGGINGFQRCYGLQILGEYVGRHTIRADIEYSYGGVVTETHTREVTAGPYQYELLLQNQKCTAIKLTLTCSLLPGSGGFRLSGVSAEVGIKQGSGIPYKNRFST